MDTIKSYLFITVRDNEELNDTFEIIEALCNSKGFSAEVLDGSVDILVTAEADEPSIEALVRQINSLPNVHRVVQENVI